MSSVVMNLAWSSPVKLSNDDTGKRLLTQLPVRELTGLKLLLDHAVP